MSFHLAVTDSGFGGLSLVARLEAGLAGAGIDITYVNACPAHTLGYNDMVSEGRKRQTLTNVLNAIDARLRPDAIIVACHTLSALLRLPGSRPARPLRGMLPTARRLLASAARRQPGQRVLVLASETIVDARPWSDGPEGETNPLRYRCLPGLASTISGDADGALVEASLARLVDGLADACPDRVLLGCTHYSLRVPCFARAFGCDVELLDPVAALARELVPPLIDAAPQGSVRVRLLSRYSPPRRETYTLATLLGPWAPRTAAAAVDYILDRELFALAPASLPRSQLGCEQSGA